VKAVVVRVGPSQTHHSRTDDRVCRIPCLKRFADDRGIAPADLQRIRQAIAIRVGIARVRFAKGVRDVDLAIRPLLGIRLVARIGAWKAVRQRRGGAFITIEQSIIIIIGVRRARGDYLAKKNPRVPRLVVFVAVVENRRGELKLALLHVFPGEVPIFELPSMLVTGPVMVMGPLLTFKTTESAATDVVTRMVNLR
jgi:hypothetical protein